MLKKGKAYPSVQIYYSCTGDLLVLMRNALCHVFHRIARHRQIAEPELIAQSSEDSDEGTWHPEREESSEDEEEEEVDDEVGHLNKIFRKSEGL